jgi:hypothetical protein
MTRIYSWARRTALSLLVLSTLAACATSRSVIEVGAAAQDATIAGIGTPPSGYVKITAVTDARKFEYEPGDPSVPSLGDEAELKDAKLVARAVGRKRNTFGKALGDIMLPENDSVALVVRRAVKAALQQKGYAVVEAGAAEYDVALPVSVEVTQFWAWLSPGFSSLPMRCDWAVTLDGPELLGPSPLALKGRADHATMAAFESEWVTTVNLGIADLTAKVREALKAPGARRVPTS